MGRPAWLGRLLTALEKGDVAPGQLDAARRHRLLIHRDEKVRSRAAKLFAGTGSTDRQKVVKEHAGALSLAGDAARGKAAFAKHCAACHRLDGVGHEVGPDLAALANKTPAYLLGEVLDPNRNLDSRYVQYTATTTRGLTYTGLLAAETATSITLKLQEGRTQPLLRADVEQLSSSGQSLMPEGMEKDLSRQDLADLLAYLTRQKKARSFPGNRPVTVRAARGGYALPATACEIYGGDICFEAPFANVGCWHGADDHVVWAVEVEKDATFDVWLDWSCADAVAGNGFVLEGGKEPLRGKVKGTGGWDRYRQAKIGQIALVAGKGCLTFRPDGALRGALLDLRGVHLVAVGTKPAFGTADKPAKTDPAALARQVLDDKLPAAQRQALINDHPEASAELLAALVADLEPGTKEEYRRIPWVWRVAIAAGKRNDAAELKKVLDVSLPKADGPLYDWQAVVLGGGVVNGISLAGLWPAEKMKELLEGSKDRGSRWKRAVEEASKMADNARVPAGTRYDALRMVALEGFEERGEQLKKYLARGTHDELTMGAISGLSDIDSPKVAPLLMGGLGHFSAGNRKLAVDALLRTEGRALALLGALAAGQVKKADLSAEQQKALKEHKSEKVRARAVKALGK
jgi:putative heme-binding domain-containing protein